MRRAVSITLAGLALMLVAGTFDAAPLFVPGVGLMLLRARGGGLGGAGGRRRELERRLDRRRVIEGEPLEVTLRGERAGFALTVAELIEPLARELPLETVAGRASTRVVVRLAAAVAIASRRRRWSCAIRSGSPGG